MNNFSDGYLVHHGIKGMHWGIRRFEDIKGHLTPAGKRRYDNKSTKIRSLKKKKRARGIGKTALRIGTRAAIIGAGAYLLTNSPNNTIDADSFSSAKAYVADKMGYVAKQTLRTAGKIGGKVAKAGAKKVIKSVKNYAFRDIDASDPRTWGRAAKNAVQTTRDIYEKVQAVRQGGLPVAAVMVGKGVISGTNKLVDRYRNHRLYGKDSSNG